MIFTIANYAIEVMVWLIIIRVFMSYFPHNPNNVVFKFIYETTQPVLNLFSKVLPASLQAPLDVTPMVSLLVIQLLVSPLVLNILFAIF